jgi:hypothetical protein
VPEMKGLFSPASGKSKPLQTFLGPLPGKCSRIPGRGAWMTNSCRAVGQRFQIRRRKRAANVILTETHHLELPVIIRRSILRDIRGREFRLPGRVL